MDYRNTGILEIDKQQNYEIKVGWISEVRMTVGNRYSELNYQDQKILRTSTHDIWEHWTAIQTVLVLISSVYRNLHHWRSNQRPQITLKNKNR